MSCTLRSNVSSKKCEARSPGRTPKRFVATSRYAIRDSLLTGTPLGRPVVPDVNIT